MKTQTSKEYIYIGDLDIPFSKKRLVLDHFGGEASQTARGALDLHHTYLLFLTMGRTKQNAFKKCA
jgi:hypothetical protein